MKKQPRTNCTTPGRTQKGDRPKEIICCAGGKSAGHILPCLTLAKQANPRHLLFFSSNSSLDMKILQNHELVTQHIPLPLAGIAYKHPLGMAKLLWAFCVAGYHLLKHRPSQLITTGGLSAVPACCAAFVLRIPIVLHELNATPGKASRFLAPLATRITVCFPETGKKFPQHKTCVGSYPLQFDPTSIKHGHTRQALELPTDATILCIIGGSQGSQFINATIRSLFENNEILARRMHVIHQTGADSADDQRAWYAQRGISHTVFSYTDRLHSYLAAANLIICRSGAGSLFECAALGTPFITIPLENVGAGHQVENAYAMSRMHPMRCRVLRQQQLLDTPSLLANVMREMLPTRAETTATSQQGLKQVS